MPQQPTMVELPSGELVPFEEAAAQLGIDLTAPVDTQTFGPVRVDPFGPPSEPPAPGNATLDDAIGLGTSALPLLAGLATSGASFPIAAGATGLAGIARSLLEGDDLSRAGLEGFGEAALEGMGRGVGKFAVPMFRGAIRMASGADDAAKFAERAGREAVDPTRQLAEAGVDAGTPISRGGVEAAGQQAETAGLDLLAELSDAPPIHRASEIIRPVQQAMGRLSRSTMNPERTRASIAKFLEGLGALPDQVPVADALAVLQRGQTRSSGIEAELEQIVLEALEAAIRSRTLTNPLSRQVESEALQGALTNLVPRSGLFPNLGTALARGGLASLAAAPLTVADPVAGSLASGMLFGATSPSNLSRGAVAASRAAPFIAPGVRTATSVVPESRSQVERRRLSR